MRPIAFAKIRLGTAYENEVAALALLMHIDDEFYINVLAQNDWLLQQVSLRAMVLEQAYGDFKAFVAANGGRFDPDEIKEDIAAAREREATETRH
jgi:hypothetical protein